MSAAAPLALPFVGRADELALLDRVLTEAAAGRGSALLVRGAGGVGKSRLLAAAAELGARRGFTVAHGRAYPVEAGVPYALFADALLPTLRDLDDAALAVLTRGGEAELAYLFPALAPPAARSAVVAGDDPAELKTRLLWNFTQFLRRFADKQPLLLVLEDVHWADASSLELLHFVARQTAGEPILILAGAVDDAAGRSDGLQALEQSLVSLGVARTLALAPLDEDETRDLICRAFEVEPEVVREFATRLYGWTRGNPYFIQETLQTLVDAGKLERRSGRWAGWDVRELTLPKTIRESLLARFGRLDRDARQTADLAAVIGTRVSHGVLRSVSSLPSEALLAALDALRGARVLEERQDGRAVVYDFAHPLVRETLYGELGMARARLLHAAVAEALEAHYGDNARDHANELAYHFARAEAEALAPKAVSYLIAAGSAALERHANREAADYLALALEQGERCGIEEATSPTARCRLLVDQARARQRLGEHDAAIALLRRARDTSGDEDAAALERRIGLALYWSGNQEEALAHWDAGLAAAEDDPLRAALLLARGSALLDLGDAARGLTDAEEALAIAERIGEPALLARVHRGLVLLYTWTGQPERAREAGARAVALAERAADVVVAFHTHWALAVLEGMTGDTGAMQSHVEACDRLAQELRSPLLWLWTAETWVEYHGATGDWDTAIGLGERAVALGRALNAQTILPRLLVWTALLHLGRDDTERAERYVEEAWALADADDPAHGDVHSIVPAHIGRAALHMWREQYTDAIRVGEAGLALAERTGYVFWAIHRLLPIVAESYCHLKDLDGARRTGARLRAYSEPLGHTLGLAWADSVDAVLAWLGGDAKTSVALLRDACEALEAIPIVPDATRLRRQLAGRLAEIGDRDAALQELRRVHESLARMGIERELDKARIQFKEVGAKPPMRSVAEGTEALTGREVEIARLVAERKSNKAIGKALGISARTVSTHLSNVFKKLGIESRGELADFVKGGGLLEA